MILSFTIMRRQLSAHLPSLSMKYFLNCATRVVLSASPAGCHFIMGKRLHSSGQTVTRIPLDQSMSHVLHGLFLTRYKNEPFKKGMWGIDKGFVIFSFYLSKKKRDKTCWSCPVSCFPCPGGIKEQKSRQNIQPSLCQKQRKRLKARKKCLKPHSLLAGL